MTPETQTPAVPHQANDSGRFDRPAPEEQPEHVGKMKLVDGGTPYCVSCYLQQPEVRHVDFAAAFDGPMVAEGATKVSIDDLIVCETCLRDAVKLLGITGDVEEVQDELRLERQQNMELRERVNGLVDYNGKLEQAVAAKEDLSK